MNNTTSSHKQRSDNPLQSVPALSALSCGAVPGTASSGAGGSRPVGGCGDCRGLQGAPWAAWRGRAVVGRHGRSRGQLVAIAGLPAMGPPKHPGNKTIKQTGSAGEAQQAGGAAHRSGRGLCRGQRARQEPVLAFGHLTLSPEL